MIGSTTSNTLFTRIAVALAWRRNEDIARRLAGFAATEAGSALDMLKAAEKGMVIEGIRLISKSGGDSGDFRAP